MRRIKYTISNDSTVNSFTVHISRIKTELLGALEVNTHTYAHMLLRIGEKAHSHKTNVYFSFDHIKASKNCHKMHWSGISIELNGLISFYLGSIIHMLLLNITFFGMWLITILFFVLRFAFLGSGYVAVEFVSWTEDISSFMNVITDMKVKWSLSTYFGSFSSLCVCAFLSQRKEYPSYIKPELHCVFSSYCAIYLLMMLWRHFPYFFFSRQLLPSFWRKLLRTASFKAKK